MKIKKQTYSRARQLLICFTGWSASPELFCLINPEGEKEETDLWICYDYRDLSFPEDLHTINPDKYETVRIVAWSLGVWVAEQVLALQPAVFWSFVKSAVAINGTGRPIDDLYGIPEAVFEGTLQHLTPDGVQRFVRRMCGNRTVLTTYLATPLRPLDEISEELLFLYREIKCASEKKTAVKTKAKDSDLPVPFPWTGAILSADDRIFPIENLRRYWRQRCPVREIEAPHYPFYRWKQWNEIWKQ